MRRCRHCAKVVVRIMTDGNGRALEVPEPCACITRKAAGLCRTCPAPLPTERATYCPECRVARRRECFRRHAAEKRGNPDPQRPAWRGDINDARRLAGTCQLCIHPVAGKRGVALYCAKHRKLRRKATMRAYHDRTNGAAWKRYQEKNRELLRQKARDAHRRSKRLRKKKAEYKREWRRKNPDKVKAQKRRHALRGKSSEAMRRRRARLGDMARVHANPAPRNERGERLCLGGCETVLTGRPKMCATCKSSQQQRAA